MKPKKEREKKEKLKNDSSASDKTIETIQSSERRIITKVKILSIVIKKLSLIILTRKIMKNKL